jgi:selenocysteine lyase/cysteine desulfurase
MAVDWQSVRCQFPALERWTFLNTATFGQLPKQATAAVEHHFEHRDELACADFLNWFDDADRIRAQAARLVSCEPNDIAFIPNASTALSLLLGGIDWKPGDRIVTLEHEFPNNLYFPALLERQGIEFVETSWEKLDRAVDSRTRLVALSTVNYTNGFRPPLEELRELTRVQGALLYLDGTQSVGALRFDCQAIQPDILAVHGYKWLLSPNGAGFMYVSPATRRWLAPNVIGWRSHHDWRNVDNLHHAAPEFKESAEKYEGGMLNFTALYAMSASIGMMLDIGPDVIEARVLELADRVRRVMREAGAELSGDSFPNYVSPIVAGRFPQIDASRLACELKEQKVLVSARHGKLRVSTHFYNNEEDVERFAAALRKSLNFSLH